MPKIVTKGLWPVLLLTGMVLVGTIFIPTNRAEAYFYPGFKWGVNYMRYELNIAGWASHPIHNAKDEWNGAGSPFLFNYLGLTANPVQKDNHNVVTRANRGNNGILGLTLVWCNGSGYSCYSGRTILEVDVEFNDYYPWGAYGEANLYDLESATVHEFGHALHLGHSSSWCGWPWEASMCNGMALGETRKRSIQGDDSNGINYIY